MSIAALRHEPRQEARGAVSRDAKQAPLISRRFACSVRRSSLAEGSGARGLLSTLARSSQLSGRGPVRDSRPPRFGMHLEPLAGGRRALRPLWRPQWGSPL